MKKLNLSKLNENGMCNGCPFNVFSEESEKIQNYGCLPDAWTIVDMYKKGEGHWKCHSCKNKCGGLSKALEQLEIEGTQPDHLLANGDNGYLNE